ncbi:hypothetical protein NKG05_26065 [Oerskovia sp. M15]
MVSEKDLHETIVKKFPTRLKNFLSDGGRRPTGTRQPLGTLR